MRKLAMTIAVSVATLSALAGCAVTPPAPPNIVQTAAAVPDLSTLVAAVKAAGLVDTLSGPGPFTVFAPTNAAFAKLPTGTVETLLKPENKAMLTKILTCHVVAGKVDAATLLGKIKAGHGKAVIQTVGGCVITARNHLDKIIITDEAGGKSNVAMADVMTSNGVVHVIDAVLLPKM